jgi:tetratricopeptide (TPR) repeat protein
LLLLKAQVEAKRSPILAIPTLKMLTELYPDDATVIVELANNYIAAEQYDESISILQEHLNVCPQDERKKIELTLAMALYKAGDKAKANAKFDEIHNSDPNDPSLLLAKTVLLKGEEKWKQITQNASEWCQKHPTDVQTQMTIAGTVGRLKDVQAQQAAEDIYKIVLKKNPDSIDAIVGLAILLQMNERYEESGKLYEKAIQIKSDELIALNNLAWIMSEEQGKYVQALELVERGLEQEPDYIDLIDTRGVIYSRLGKHQNAIQDFKKCISMYPENFPALAATHFHLAKALTALGQNKEAHSNIQKALELNNKFGGLSATDLAEAKKILDQ